MKQPFCGLEHLSAFTFYKRIRKLNELRSGYFSTPIRILYFHDGKLSCFFTHLKSGHFHRGHTGFQHASDGMSCHTDHLYFFRNFYSFFLQGTQNANPLNIHRRKDGIQHSIFIQKLTGTFVAAFKAVDRLIGFCKNLLQPMFCYGF